MKQGAEFSEDRKYRYNLWRIWDESKPYVMFIGLNPSTANETEPDPTIKSVIRIATNNGYGGVFMMNCFPLVSSDPIALYEFYATEIFHSHFLTNNVRLKQVSERCESVVAAWGNFDIVKDTERDKQLMDMFPDMMALKINKNGSPKHPLYCKSDSKLIDF